MLTKYLRNVNGQPFGCVVGLEDGKVGFSLCNPKDHFNKEMAKTIAAGRANELDPVHVFDRLINVPNKHREVLRQELVHMQNRSLKYFK